MKAKLLITLLLLLLAVMQIEAKTKVGKTTVDKIKYELYSDGTATLVKGTGGDVVIPAQVEFKGEVYKVTMIGERAFEFIEFSFFSTKSVKSVDIPNTVTSIGEFAFEGNHLLRKLVIPSSVVSIEKGAFQNCVALQELVIPNSVIYIGICAFFNCNLLESIVVPDKEPRYELYKNGVFHKCKNICYVKGHTVPCPEYIYKPRWLPREVAAVVKENNEKKMIYYAAEQLRGNGQVEVTTMGERKKEETTSPQVVEKVELSDVDMNIPRATTTNDKTFAVIIVNEDYKHVDDVEFATNDGKTFRDYCSQTLGLPERNIRFINNAGLTDVIIALDWIKNVAESYRGEASVIFYYVGHGIPDEATGNAFLLPVDGVGNNTRTAYRLSEIYDSLGSLPTQSVTVFMDACFSGAKRDGSALVAARGVAIKAKNDAPAKGKMVIFTAAQGDETAHPYREKRHGLFTYFLLKKLQESGGDATFSELEQYLRDKVQQTSVVVNNKRQSPAVLISPELADYWHNMRLK